MWSHLWTGGLSRVFFIIDFFKWFHLWPSSNLFPLNGTSALKRCMLFLGVGMGLGRGKEISIPLSLCEFPTSQWVSLDLYLTGASLKREMGRWGCAVEGKNPKCAITANPSLSAASTYAVLLTFPSLLLSFTSRSREISMSLLQHCSQNGHWLSTSYLELRRHLGGHLIQESLGW